MLYKISLIKKERRQENILNVYTFPKLFCKAHKNGKEEKLSFGTE